jgi:NADPH-dependent 2,4-dienoyl-CoA reductase/sulfur reductase-like enzyme
MRELAADIVVVGAGPAGLEAARAAAAALASAGRPPVGGDDEGRAGVVLVDAGPQPGGQIWRARRDALHPRAQQLAAAAAASGVRILRGRRIVGELPRRGLLLGGPDADAAPRRLAWRRLVLATGARERLLPFPGWTLPGVFGAGGLQALAKGGWPVAGRRVVVAGTGPLLIAAAVTLQREGAEIVRLVDEASWATLARFGATLLGHPAQALQALRFAAALAGVRMHAGWRIVAAEGAERLERVVLAPTHGRRPNRITIQCDALAAGWGLVPDTGLARLLGCALAERFGAPAVLVDETGRTSRSDVFAAGEVTGIAGARAARIAGRRAGRAAAVDLLEGRGAAVAPTHADADVRLLAREHRFGAAVARSFPLPDDLASRLTPETLVCRCEDVAWGELQDHAHLRAAKLVTRCGMGHCQGRLCHDALSLITGARPLEPHLPLMPVELGALLAWDDDPAPAEEPGAASMEFLS